MPTPVFIQDTVQGASMEATRMSARRTKTGIVKNIDTIGHPDPYVMDKALTAILETHAWGESYNPDNPAETAFLAKIFILPITFNQCRVQLVYDINEFPVQSSYYIRDDGYMSGWQGNVLPGTGESIGTSWEEPEPDWEAETGGSADPDWTPQVVPFDYVPMNLSMPARTISVEAVILGTPPSGLTAANGHVNDGLWYGLPKGYWRIDRITSNVIGYTGFYGYSAVVATRNNKDWSETGILRNRQTGRYIPAKQDEIDELIGRTYSYGVMQGGTGDRLGKAGIVRTCPHPEVSMTSLMGF